MSSSLLSVKAERRVVAVAIFRNHTLRYAAARNLSSDPEVAASSALDFVLRSLRRFDVGSAALEDAHASDEARSVELLNRIEGLILQQGIPTHRFSKQSLFEAYAVEPLTSRKELRAVVGEFWPQLNTGDFPGAVLDAAALGLYADTEDRLGSKTA